MPIDTTALQAPLSGNALFIKTILPVDYKINEGITSGGSLWIRCRSEKGIRKAPYQDTKSLTDEKFTVTDAEDDEHWSYIFEAIKQHFGEKFMEVYHETCSYHLDFFIYYKP
jgi:hypothetical protein